MKKEYFQRQMILPEIRMEGQEAIAQASVLVVGSGALGIPVVQYLSAAGVGVIGLVDDDIVHPSNLHRQVLFGVEDKGKFKAELVGAKLSPMYPWVKFQVHSIKLVSGNALDLLRDYDLVLDCTDNFPTRYLINDACVKLNKPFISASILRWEGQLAVYNYKGSGTYRCLFPEPPENAQDCATAGVVGALAGVMGSMQAMEAVKIITNSGEVLADQLLLYNGLEARFQKIRFSRTEPFLATRIEDTEYDSSCNIAENVLLVDVREPWEYEEKNKGGINIPLSELPFRLDELRNAEKVLFYCDHGNRSAMAVKVVSEQGLQHCGKLG